MKKRDARRLEHKGFTQLRQRAVAAVQGGESPELVACVMGISRAAIYGWLTRPAMRLETVGREKAWRTPAEIGWPRLVHGTDGGHSYQGQIRLAVESQFGEWVAQPNGAQCSAANVASLPARP